MKKYWFYLEPYTFFWVKRKAMIYNTLSGAHILFEPDSTTKPIVDAWNDADNMYGVELTEVDMEKESIRKLVFQIRDTFSGDIIELDAEQKTPVSLKPFLNFQMNRQRVEDLDGKEANKQYGDRVLHHLFEVSIYINGKCQNDCTYCNEYYKQTLCCVKSDSGFLQPQQVESILQRISNSNVKCINILGGDLLSNELLPEYINVLNQFDFTKNYYSHYLNINEQVHLMKSHNATLRIIVTFPFDEHSLEQAYKLTEGFNVLWVFIISSEVEYFQADEIIERFNIQDFKITPFYNGNNYDFFSENIFTTLEEIQQTQLNRRQIFANQSINSIEFGKITIMSGGKIYTNVNREALGSIDDDIRELIYSELVTEKTWLRVRDQAPCSDCIYQWLCPSPSNYETLIGKPNLCHIIP